MGQTGDLVLTNFYNPHLNGGRKMRNPVKDQQAFTEMMLRRIISEMCMNRFEWKGLPDSINPRFLEMEIFYRGMCVYYHDKLTGQDVVAQGTASGSLNVFDDPVSFTVIGSNRQSLTLSVKKAVPIYANYLRTPETDVVEMYSMKIAKFDRTIEITGDNMRQPKVIKAKESQRLTWSNINRQHEEGQGVIMAAETLNLEDIEVLDLGVPSGYLSDLQTARTRLWNECMGLLGINHANQDKKERLVSSEVGANDEQVDAMKNVALNERQAAAKRINDMFGLNVSVDYKQTPLSDPDGESADSGDKSSEAGEGK
jgi:hypothetical protein